MKMSSGHESRAHAAAKRELADMWAHAAPDSRVCVEYPVLMRHAQGRELLAVDYFLNHFVSVLLKHRPFEDVSAAIEVPDDWRVFPEDHKPARAPICSGSLGKCKNCRLADHAKAVARELAEAQQREGVQPHAGGMWVPSYDQCKEALGKTAPMRFADVAVISRDGAVTHICEVTYKSPVDEGKRELYGRLPPSVEVREAQAATVLGVLVADRPSLGTLTKTIAPALALARTAGGTGKDSLPTTPQPPPQTHAAPPMPPKDPPALAPTAPTSVTAPAPAPTALDPPPPPAPAPPAPAEVTQHVLAFAAVLVAPHPPGTRAFFLSMPVFNAFCAWLTAQQAAGRCAGITPGPFLVFTRNKLMPALRGCFEIKHTNRGNGILVDVDACRARCTSAGVAVPMLLASTADTTAKAGAAGPGPGPGPAHAAVAVAPPPALALAAPLAPHHPHEGGEVKEAQEAQETSAHRQVDTHAFRDQVIPELVRLGAIAPTAPSASGAHVLKHAHLRAFVNGVLAHHGLYMPAGFALVAAVREAIPGADFDSDAQQWRGIALNRAVDTSRMPRPHASIPTKTLAGVKRRRAHEEEPELISS